MTPAHLRIQALVDSLDPDKVPQQQSAVMRAFIKGWNEGIKRIIKPQKPQREMTPEQLKKLMDALEADIMRDPESEASPQLSAAPSWNERTESAESQIEKLLKEKVGG